MSLALAGVFFAVALVLGALATPDLIVGVFTWLAIINAVLAVFNLMPATPLDGGRVLRAFLWKRHGDRFRASIAAARAGRAFGWLLNRFSAFPLVENGDRPVGTVPPHRRGTKESAKITGRKVVRGDSDRTVTVELEGRER